MGRRNWVRMLAVVAVVVMGLAACSSSDDEDAAEPEGESGAETIPESSEDTSPPAEETGGPIIENFAFTNMTAPAGEAVTVTNRDTVPHTITADDDSFDTGRIEGGATAELTAPGAPGTYAVHCEVHPSITGELVVT